MNELSFTDQLTASFASAQDYGSSGGSSAAASGGASGGAPPGAGGAPSGAGAPGASMMMLPPYLLAFLNRVNKATIAHGVLMCLAFVIFMPAGAIIIRIGKFKGVVYVHAGLQMFAYILALAGMGLGAYVCHAPTVVGRPNQVIHHP